MHKQELVRFYASRGATQGDIAKELEMTQGNISQNYRDAYEEGRTNLKMSMRDWQIRRAREGDTTMLIHLGKVYCEDQKDTSDLSLEPGTLKTYIDTLCTNSHQNKSTSSKTQPDE